MTVTNIYGKPINYEAAVILMDDDLREQLAAEGIESEQAFFDVYCAAHMQKYGVPFQLNEPVPCY